jgi:hypothetical protein
MSRPPPLAELENILRLLVAEHRKLLAHVEAQQSAMRAMDLAALDVAMNQQEAARLRIATIENRRRAAVVQIARAARIDPNGLTLTKLATLYPAQGQPLLLLRDELKEVAAQIGKRTQVSGRLAGALLGHLNTVVRLLAGAVEKAGLYSKHGVPQVSSRIGVMEAVG